MAFLFSRQKNKGPAEIVRGVRDNLTKFRNQTSSKSTQEDLKKDLSAMREQLQGTPEVEPSPETVNYLAEETYKYDILTDLTVVLPYLDFEGRKSVTIIFNCLIRHTPNNQQRCVMYLSQHPDAIINLVGAYSTSDSASNSTQILKEAFKCEILASIALHHSSFWNFFTYVQAGRFDTSSDAFIIFKELLTRHKVMVAEFLMTNYDKFFFEYNNLLTCSNYITKRQSIKLLGEILLDRANYSIMTLYVDSPDNLKLTMTLLRDKSKNIQYEAFHVFKVFVANPKKSAAVEKLLVKNKQQLLVFLPKFHEDRKDDEQFNDEKAFLLKQIEALPDTVPQQIQQQQQQQQVPMQL